MLAHDHRDRCRVEDFFGVPGIFVWIFLCFVEGGEDLFEGGIVGQAQKGMDRCNVVLRSGNHDVFSVLVVCQSSAAQKQNTGCLLLNLNG